MTEDEPGNDEFRVAIRKADSSYDYAIIKAKHIYLEPDPRVFKDAKQRYYILRDARDRVVGRFNKKDVAGVFKGDVQLNVRRSGDGDFHIEP